MTSDNDQLLQVFLTEAKEHLDNADRGLIDLENSPFESTIISLIFRAVHSIKGGSGFYGLSTLEGVAHAAETLLNEIREKRVEVSTDVVSALLRSADALRGIVENVSTDGTEGVHDYAALKLELKGLGETSAKIKKEVPDVSQDISTNSDDDFIDFSLVNNRLSTVEHSNRVGDILIRDQNLSPKVVQGAAQQQRDGDPRHIGEILVEQGVVAPKAVRDALEKQQRGKRIEVEQTVRVNVQTLTKLMDLVAELVLSRNEVQQISNSNKLTVLYGACQQLSRITSDLQGQVLKTRMQPVSNLFSPFQRVIRDLSISSGKKVELSLEGQDTELDKSLLEAIKDPLTHLVRNAIDHGIEPPADRVSLNKNPTAKFTMRASSQSGYIVIAVSDDGRGIDPKKVRSKAIEKGLLSDDGAALLSDRDSINLIFSPGFSTAEKVTNISGRGVGMDVVRTNVEKVGGTVEVDSVVGIGTTIKIKIPLTLAIIPALITMVGNHQFAIPQTSLVELIRLTVESGKNDLHSIDGNLVYTLRGRLLPLIYLSDVLGMTQMRTHEQNAVLSVAVVNSNNSSFGIIVDHISDAQEIVVKPLGEHLKQVPLYSGAALMGDGSIALILSVEGIASYAKVATVDTRLSKTTKPAETPSISKLLIVQTPDDGRLAIPVEHVIRLEKLQRSKLETAGAMTAIQYRNKILPVIRLNQILTERRQLPRSPDEDSKMSILPLIVMTDVDTEFGLIVDRILDIVEEESKPLSKSGRTNVLGTSIVRDRITEFLDVNALKQTLAAAASGSSERLNAQ